MDLYHLRDCSLPSVLGTLWGRGAGATSVPAHSVAYACWRGTGRGITGRRSFVFFGDPFYDPFYYVLHSAEYPLVPCKIVTFANGGSCRSSTWNGRNACYHARPNPILPVNLPVSQATEFLDCSRNDMYEARLKNGLPLISTVPRRS